MIKNYTHQAAVGGRRRPCFGRGYPPGCSTADRGDEAWYSLIGHLGMLFPEGHGRADDEVEEDDENDG